MGDAGATIPWLYNPAETDGGKFGFYGSRDRNVISAHLNLCESLEFDWILLDWWGSPEGRGEERIHIHEACKAYALQARERKVPFSIFIDTLGSNGFTAADAAALEHFTRSEGYLRHWKSKKPVVGVYKRAAQQMGAKWLNDLSRDCHLILDEPRFGKIPATLEASATWYSRPLKTWGRMLELYARARTAGLGLAPFIMPGFDNRESRDIRYPILWPTGDGQVDGPTSEHLNLEAARHIDLGLGPNDALILVLNETVERCGIEPWQADGIEGPRLLVPAAELIAEHKATDELRREQPSAGPPTPRGLLGAALRELRVSDRANKSALESLMVMKQLLRNQKEQQ